MWSIYEESMGKDAKIKNVKPQRSRPDALIAWHQLLEWQKDNEYILTKYRQASFSFRRSFRSIWRIHNETVNIWSHGLGAMAFSIIPCFEYLYADSTVARAAQSDVAAHAIFFTSVTICFTFSFIFHTFLNHSPGVWRIASQLDHLGIVVVIWGSTIPSTHFAFYCEPLLKKTYYALASLAALASAYATFDGSFRTPRGRRWRFLLYCMLGVTAFFPAAHAVRNFGWAAASTRMSLPYFVGLGLLNFTGAAIYAVRIPERWKPGCFDLVGTSHQIMHVLVICGALSHTIGLLQAESYWRILRERGLACE